MGRVLFLHRRSYGAGPTKDVILVKVGPPKQRLVKIGPHTTGKNLDLLNKLMKNRTS